MFSCRSAPVAAIVEISITVVLVAFPDIVIVSALPVIKLTSIPIVPPPVRFPANVNESSPALSCIDNVPERANSPVVND